MGSPTNPPLDVPDADAAEQSRDLRPQGSGGAPPNDVPRGHEVDEFDAVEQSIVVEEEDEEEYR